MLLARIRRKTGVHVVILRIEWGTVKDEDGLGRKRSRSTSGGSKGVVDKDTKWECHPRKTGDTLSLNEVDRRYGKGSR
jgi:hypothetical protein